MLFRAKPALVVSMGNSRPIVPGNYRTLAGAVSLKITHGSNDTSQPLRFGT